MSCHWCGVQVAHLTDPRVAEVLGLDTVGLDAVQ